MMDTMRAHSGALSRGYLPMWTIYDRPTDFPDGYIARMHVTNGGMSSATDATVTAGTLEAVREKLPPGLIRIARSPTDDPKIVETWL